MSMIKGITCMGALALAIAVSTARAAAPADIHEAVAKDFDKRLKSLFLHFHQNPELSFRESKTAARLAKELRALGYKVTEKVGGTGVVTVAAVLGMAAVCKAKVITYGISPNADSKKIGRERKSLSGFICSVNLQWCAG